MNTTDILNKLSEMGLPADIVSQISEKIASGTDFLTLVQENGLQNAISSLGIDVSNLTNIDFSSFGNVSELFGQDVDGDGLTGFAEIQDTISDKISEGGGILDQIKNLFK